jgi:GH15 family glucan-1,4-alpha-glucosidase
MIVGRATAGPALAPDPCVRLEEYAVIGDTQTIALVASNGSIDWLCIPRFDSGACFAALLGGREHGRWKIAPTGELRRVRRRYRDATLLLETEMETEEGTIRILDFMPIRGHAPDVVRIVEGVRGRVTVEHDLVIRYEYGAIVPWERSKEGRLHAIAGPDALVLASDVPIEVPASTNACRFAIGAGERARFALTWHPSYERAPASPDPDLAARQTYEWWRSWASKAQLSSPYEDAVLRSLLTLKALTYAPCGGIVAAGTTSLPESLGGVRNWDYRFCWVRDATLTLQALLHAGFSDEARAWREWLVRAVAGEPAKLQILYGVAGERWSAERDLAWLPGYEGSRPVRVGNAAVLQLQLDVYGEIMDALYVARSSGVDADDDAWAVQRSCLDWLEGHWDEPDHGMWEIRAERADFTLSKVMAWVAFDRAAKTVEQHGLEGPAARWKALRDQIHAEVCDRAFDRGRNSFTQAYGEAALDANLLLLPIVGFLPARDERILGTIDAIQRELMVEGFVCRYPTREHGNRDGLPGREGTFIACSFWMVDALVLAGRREEAVRLFERVLAIRNDVGLLSEEYDPAAHRLIGNFPQAYSHVGLINSARNLAGAGGPAARRARRTGDP